VSDLLHAASDAAHHLTHLAAPPDPSKGGGDAPPGASKLTKILRWAFWCVSALGVLGIMAVSAKMFTSFRNGEGSEHMSMLGRVLVGCILAASASGIVGALL
jgi:hypothetical protein